MTNRPKSVDDAIKWMDEAAFSLYPTQLGADYHTILNYITQLEQVWQELKDENEFLKSQVKILEEGRSKLTKELHDAGH